MVARRFATLVPHLPHSAARRRVLGRLLGGLAATGLLLSPIEAAARRRRKKRRKKRPGPRPLHPKPSACARTCGTVCTYCVTRAADSLVCGEGTVTACELACDDDFDCLSAGFRYCITTIEEVETGRVVPACETPGGHCANISACEV